MDSLSPCVRCRHPVDLPSTRGLCVACRDELARARQPADLTDGAAGLRAEAGIPSDLPLHFGVYPGDLIGRYFRGYFVGTVSVDVDAAPGLWRCPWIVNLPGDDRPRAVLRWRVWRQGAASHLDRTWAPGGAPTYRLQYIQLPSMEEIKQLHLLSVRLEGRARTGRLPLNEDALADVRLEKVREATDLKQRHPGLTWPQIAARLGIPADTLKDWRGNKGLRDKLRD